MTQEGSAKLGHESALTPAESARVSEQLGRWGVQLQSPLQSTLISGGRSNPTYRLTDGLESWALRRPPFGHVLPTAHDMLREFRVISALGSSPVPVPRTIGLCQDHAVLGADFFVMEWLHGRTLRTPEDTLTLTPEQRRELSISMVHALAALHSVEPAEVGLADFGRPAGFLERQLRRWSTQWVANQTRQRQEVDSILATLAERMPQSPRGSIVHGDFKLDNVMVDTTDPASVVALLDWELATLGDPLSDLGMLLSFWDQPGETANPISAGATAVGGFLTREEIIATYADVTGLQPDNLDWYTALAYVKTAVILEGIHARHLAGHTNGNDFEVGDMVDVLIERAAELVDATTLTPERTAP